MTNREYLLDNLIDRLKCLTKYVEELKNDKPSFNIDNEICDIADSIIYLDGCKNCPIDKFCSHFADEESCYSNWWRYLQVEGDKMFHSEGE